MLFRNRQLDFRMAHAVIRVAACLVGGATLGFVAGWTLAVWYPQAGSPAEGERLVRRAALAHVIYAPEVRHPVEVPAAQKAHLTAWLSKRLEADVRAPQLEGAGFALLGGRLLPAEAFSGAASLPAAQFMYENTNGRRVTLYVRNANPQHCGSQSDYARIGTVAVSHWTDGALEYALASADVRASELRALAQSARRRGRDSVKR